MSEQEDPTLAKIRKLLAKAEDPATTPAEAETYTAKVAELIAKHGIDQALLTAADPTRDAVTNRYLFVEAPYALDKVYLLAYVAEALKVKVIRFNVGGGYKVHLFGYGTDLDRVELLYTSLLVQASHGAAAAAYNVPWGENLKSYRKSWYQGYASAIYRRLVAAERRAEQQATRGGKPGVALVLADRSALVQAAINAAYPDMRSGAKRKLHGSGRAAGYAAGERADLGDRRLAEVRSQRRIGN